MNQVQLSTESRVDWEGEVWKGWSEVAPLTGSSSGSKVGAPSRLSQGGRDTLARNTASVHRLSLLWKLGAHFLKG